MIIFFSEWKIDYGICIFMCIIWYSVCIYVYIIAKYVYSTNIFMYSTFCPFIFYLHSVFIFSSSIFGFLCKLSRILIHITDFLQYYFNTINLLFLFWILRLRLQLLLHSYLCQHLLCYHILIIIPLHSLGYDCFLHQCCPKSHTVTEIGR